MKINKVNYRIRIFMYFAFLVCIMITIIGIVTYFSITKIVERNYIKSNQNTVIQLKNSTEVLMQQIDTMIKPMCIDSGIEMLADRYEWLDYKDIFDIAGIFSKIIISNNYFKSIYVYYFNQNKVLDINNYLIKLQDLETVEQRTVLQNAKELYFKDTSSGEHRNVYYMKDVNGQNVLTVIMPVSLLAVKPRAILVATLKEHYLDILLDSIKINKDDSIAILDSEMNVLMSTSNSNILNKLEIPLYRKDSGTYKYTKNGVTYIASFLTSSKLNWSYVYIIPANEIHNEVAFIWRLMLLVFMMFLTIGVGSSIILSGSLYTPIRKLKALFYDDERNTVFKDDIHIMGRNIKGLMNRNRDMEILLKESIPVIKNSFLVSLLKNGCNDEDEMWGKLEHYNTSIKKGGLFGVCILGIDNYQTVIKKYMDKQMDILYIYQYETLLDTCRNKNICIETVKIDENQIAAILSVGIDGKEDASSLYSSILYEIHSRLRENMKITWTFGAGGVCKSISELYQSHTEACIAYEYRVILGGDRVITIDEVPRSGNSVVAIQKKLEKSIFNCLSQSDEETAMKHLEEYFRQAMKNIRNNNDVRYIFMHLLGEIMEYASGMSIDLDEMLKWSDLDYKDLQDIENISDAKMWFEKLLKSLYACISDMKKNKDSVIAKKILEYIERRCMCEDLSLDILSVEIRYSVPYLEKLFKNLKGMPIKEYITYKRIEEAKRLLENSRLKIKEIGEKVGYGNIHSFISIFKKHQNESPNEYRKRITI
jgi:two-component system, response regulator YesN